MLCKQPAHSKAPSEADRRLSLARVTPGCAAVLDSPCQAPHTAHGGPKTGSCRRHEGQPDWTHK